MSKWTKFALLGALLLIIAAIPLAKMPSDNGSIEGYITDEMGPVPGALVEAHQQATEVFVHAESDAMGLFRVENLRPGRYSLWVQSSAHDSVWIAQVPVEGGRAARQDVFLRRTRWVLPTVE